MWVHLECIPLKRPNTTQILCATGAHGAKVDSRNHRIGRNFPAMPQTTKQKEPKGKGPDAREDKK